MVGVAMSFAGNGTRERACPPTTVTARHFPAFRCPAGKPHKRQRLLGVAMTAGMPADAPRTLKGDRGRRALLTGVSSSRLPGKLKSGEPALPAPWSDDRRSRASRVTPAAPPYRPTADPEGPGDVRPSEHKSKINECAWTDAIGALHVETYTRRDVPRARGSVLAWYSVAAPSSDPTVQERAERDQEIGHLLAVSATLQCFRQI